MKKKGNQINIVALIGLILTILTILGGIVYQTAQVRGDVENSKLLISQMQSDQKSDRERISGCEIKYQKIDTDISYIKEMITETNKDVKELMKNDK